MGFRQRLTGITPCAAIRGSVAGLSAADPQNPRKAAVTTQIGRYGLLAAKRRVIILIVFIFCLFVVCLCRFLCLFDVLFPILLLRSFCCQEGFLGAQ